MLPVTRTIRETVYARLAECVAFQQDMQTAAEDMGKLLTELEGILTAARDSIESPPDPDDDCNCYQARVGLEAIKDCMHLVDVLRENLIDSSDADLEELAEEVKQVALDTHSGSTSPIALGNWLY